LQRTAKKCTKIYNARTRLLFGSLNLLLGDVLVAVVVVVCLNSLILSVKDMKIVDFFPRSKRGVGEKAKDPNIRDKR